MEHLHIAWPSGCKDLNLDSLLVSRCKRSCTLYTQRKTLRRLRIGRHRKHWMCCGIHRSKGVFWMFSLLFCCGGGRTVQKFAKTHDSHRNAVTKGLVNWQDLQKGEITWYSFPPFSLLAICRVLLQLIADQLWDNHVAAYAAMNQRKLTDL